MTQVVSTRVSSLTGNSLGFRTRSRRAHLEDLKSRCARIGRMDLYHAASADPPPSYSIAERLSCIAAGVAAGRVDVSVLEDMVGKLVAARQHPARKHSNSRYQNRAQTSARSTIAWSPNTCRERKAEQALALPDLFPDAEPS